MNTALQYYHILTLGEDGYEHLMFCKQSDLAKKMRHVYRHDGPLTDWPAVAERARGHPRVVGVAPYVHGEAMLTRGRYVRGALVQGVLPEQEPEV